MRSVVTPTESTYALAGTVERDGQAWWKFFLDLEREHEKTGKWSTDSKWQQEFLRLNANLEKPDDPSRLMMGFLRPPLVQLRNSKNILVEGVTLKDSPFWTLNPVLCDNLTLTGITIVNPEAGPNTDGINPESCSNVHISDCHIDVGDDCITIKSGRDAEGRRINPLTPQANSPTIKLVDVEHAYVHDCFVARPTKVFMSVEGEKTKGVLITDSYLAEAEKPVELGQGVDKRAVTYAK